MKLLAISSFGGHWFQLVRLKNALSKFDTYYATCERNSDIEESFVIRDCSGSDSVFRIFFCSITYLFLLLRLRPKIVISTGALPGLIIIVFAKLIFRSRTVWIDSIANGDEISRSGMNARYFSDVWLTQWPELAESTGAEFIGSVL